MTKVEEYLKQNSIEFIRHEHPAVYTCEDAEKYCKHISGISSKNLFLRDEKKSRFFLVIIPDYKRADLKVLAQTLGVKKLSFASAGSLKSILGVAPGSVSPFALINDGQKKTELYIDQDVWESKIVQFHPNDNTATLELSHGNFAKYLGCTQQKPVIVQL